MNAKKILAVAAITVTGALGIGSSALAAGTAPTDVTIKGENGDYYGKVSSPNRYCLSERVVVVYKQVGATPNRQDDRKIGMDLTGSNGKWSAGNTGYKSGKFYAYVKRYSLVAKGGDDHCASARSDVISR
jgi:hypothetical protein